MNKQFEDIRVRDIQPADHKAVKAISQEMHDSLRKIYRPSDQAQSINQSHTPFTRIVAICENKVVGMATYERDGDTLYFGALGVSKSFQKQGIARQLIEYIENEAIKIGLSKITCGTVQETENEIIFHKLGFKTVSVTESEKFISQKDNKAVIHELVLEKVVS